MGTIGLGNGSLRMDDVYLEGATPDGPAVVGHLSVIVDTEGITFLGPDPGERRTVAWERTSPLTIGPPVALESGEPVTCLEFVVDGRPLRLLVPSKKEVDGAQEAATPADLTPVDLTPVDLTPVDLTAAPVEAPALPEPPPPALPEPPVPAFAEPPAPVLAEPPAPGLAEPPAPALAEPPAPVLLEPPPPAPVVEGAGVEFDVVSDPVVEDSMADQDDPAPTRPRGSTRRARRRLRLSHKPSPPPAQNLVRLVIFTVLAGLIPIAAGVRYFHTQGSTGRIPAGLLSDTAIAARVGIQKGDLPGWSTVALRMGNPFAAGATTDGAAALRTAEQASTILARCLHVPVSAVDGAFGMGSAASQRTAEVTSPSYADPSGNGGAVSSVVDVVQSAKIGQADASVFQNPALFATCYQPYVQAMLPYAAGSGGVGFATATVQPVVVPVPDGPGSRHGGGVPDRADRQRQRSDQDRREHRHRRLRRAGAGDVGNGEQPRVLARRSGPPRAHRGDPGPRRGPAVSVVAAGLRAQPGVRRPIVHSVR